MIGEFDYIKRNIEEVKKKSRFSSTKSGKECRKY
jgi:hypothetical protein